jgi:hypothetical protein
LTEITAVQDPILVMSNGTVAVNRLDFTREPASPQSSGRVSKSAAPPARNGAAAAASVMP